MIRDLRMLAGGVDLAADVCLIGAGAAGVTLALELKDANVSVVLLESGGLNIERNTQDLNAGEVSGLDYKGLTQGRARVLGGATKLWYGQCIRLDQIDFEKRAWVRHSGWPIAASDLDGWYSRAENFFRIAGEAYDQQIYKRLGIEPPHWNGDRVRTHFTIYSPHLDFGTLHHAFLERASEIQVLLHANATEVETDATGAACAVRVRTLTGQTARVRARVVVLCAGGIENARLLLLSNSSAKQGLGNAQDLVGRFLQDHPNGHTATIATSDVRALNDLFALQYRGALRYFPKFPLGDDTQRREHALNCTSHLVFDYPEESGIAAIKDIYRAARRRTLPPNLTTQVGRALRHLPEVVRGTSRRYFKGKSPLGNPSQIRLQCHTEQEPDPQSRITLSDSRDALGLPRAQVNWRVNQSERHTVSIMTKVMQTEFKRLGLGDVQPESWLTEPGNDWKSRLTDCFHHIGTTRMADAPASGVVDRNCQVFGVRNLFVAGSSVFPTSGYANPTLTIVALSMRLASHLKVQLEMQP